jgi:hypothetical protein
MPRPSDIDILLSFVPPNNGIGTQTLFRILQEKKGWSDQKSQRILDNSITNRNVTKFEDGSIRRANNGSSEHDEGLSHTHATQEVVTSETLSSELTSEEKEFIETLRSIGGSAGNKALREQLKWADLKYWTVQKLLIQKTRIMPGRGKGGSVSLPDLDRFPLKSFRISSPKAKTERDLYKPIVAQIITKWIATRGYEAYVYEETHSQGSRKEVRGKFSRPDVTIVGFKRYVYLPQRVFEVVTFEIKPASEISVLGILEAISHRETAHLSVAIYNVSKEQFESKRFSDPTALTA